MLKVLLPSAYLRSDLDDLDKVSYFYSRFVSDNGAIPIIAPSVKSLASEYVSMVDAVILIGGVNDVSPKFYNQDINGSKHVNIIQDEFELEILKEAILQKKPVLGICRGMQLINIHFGGSLIQHLQSSDLHSQYEKQEEFVHSVNFSKSRFFADDTFMVNSVHHQAIDEVGSGIKVIATSDDGLIEACEHESLPIVAVQWHPECIPNSDFSKKLFKWLSSF